MDKLNLMYKQLVLLHNELRKVKRFHKESSKNFKNFSTAMNGSLKVLSKGDLFNDIHYMNIINISIIDCFNMQILNQSASQARIHKRLKEEGNYLKSFEKEIEKRIKSLHSQIKKEEKAIFKENFSGYEENAQPHEIVGEMTGEIESTFKEISKTFTSIRASIKHSFDEYLNTLASFAETKDKLTLLQIKSNENYNDCSPILDKKLNLLMNFHQGEEYSSNIERNLKNTRIDNSQVPLKEFNDLNIDEEQVKHSDYTSSSYANNANTRIPATNVLKNSSTNSRSKIKAENSYYSYNNSNNESDLPYNTPNQMYQQSEENHRYNQLYDNYEGNSNNNSNIPVQREGMDYNDYSSYGSQANQFREKTNQNMKINASSSHLSLLTPLKPRRIFPSYVSTSVGKSKSNLNNYQQDSNEIDNEMADQDKSQSRDNRSRLIDAYYNSKLEVVDNSRSADKENCSRASNKMSNYLKSHLK